MATVDEIKQLALDLKDTGNILVEALVSEDLKLDEIRAFIANLQTGGAATQADLDSIASMLGEAKTIITDAKAKADANLAETEALDEPVTP